MAVISQNGWQAATTYTGHNIPLVPLRWVTGNVRAGDVHTVLDHLGERFNREVEPIDKASSWGFAPRPIRGTSTTLSNHASGTAVDFNAPHHGIGRTGTFTPAKVRAIERILTDLGGVVRWGGHYSGRKDEMHFEIDCTPTQLARVAKQLRNPTTPPNPTVSEEDDDMPKAIIFSSPRKGGDSQYIAFPHSRTYEHIDDNADRNDFTNALTRQGFEVEEWKNASGNMNVGNPDVFGKFVGGGPKPTGAKRED